MYLKATARMQNDNSAQALMINSLAAMRDRDSINSTYRKLTEDGPES